MDNVKIEFEFNVVESKVLIQFGSRYSKSNYLFTNQVDLLSGPYIRKGYTDGLSQTLG